MPRLSSLHAAWGQLTPEQQAAQHQAAYAALAASARRLFFALVLVAALTTPTRAADFGPVHRVLEGPCPN